MRYQRQNFEINIAVPGGVLTEEMLEKALADFHAEHKRSYGYCKPEATVQFVSYRVSAIGIIDKPDLKPAELHPEAPIPAPIEVRKVLFQGKTKYVYAPVYKRDEFVPGQTIPGPCICEQKEIPLTCSGRTAVFRKTACVVRHMASHHASASCSAPPFSRMYSS